MTSCELLRFQLRLVTVLCQCDLVTKMALPCHSLFNLCSISSCRYSGLNCDCVQLDLPYLVCPKGVLRVLSDPPPSSLCPPEVRASVPFLQLSICSSQQPAAHSPLD